MNEKSTSSRTTLDYYNRSAADYHDRVDRGHTPYLNDFINMLSKGQKVLDLGCGPGHCARDMAIAGLDVEATDGASEMVAIANTFKGVSAKVALFDELSDQNRFDAIWANFSLLHVPRERFPDCLKRIHTALKTNGLFHIGMKVDQTDGTDRLGRHYTYYRIDELDDYLTQAGFTITQRHFGSGKGMAGQNEPWVVIWATKTKVPRD